MDNKEVSRLAKEHLEQRLKHITWDLERIQDKIKYQTDCWVEKQKERVITFELLEKVNE